MSNQPIDGATLKRMILQAASNLEAQKEDVNALNVFPVPDGDTGTNMSMTMTSATREVERNGTHAVEEVAAAAAQGSLMGARGNSGVILSQLFRGFAKGCVGRVTLDGRALAQALQEGVETAYKAVMKPVEGTILTVARESAAVAAQAANEHSSPVLVMQAVAEAAERSLMKTPELLPVLKKAGVVDSGGKGLCVIFQGYCQVLSGDTLPAPSATTSAPMRTERHDTSPASHIAFMVDAEISDITFPYDCELFIRRPRDGKPIPMDEVAELLKPMGDSIYVVGSGDLAKVHIHSDNPGPVLSLCIQYGDLIDIVIHNMHEQHQDLLGHAVRPSESGADSSAPFIDAHEPTAIATEESGDEHALSVAAVAVGDGIEAIFRSLGAAQIIRGGQTMNPSTQDLLTAIERCPTQHVILLPNNKNIILAGEQAAALSPKRVTVIPSRSIPQGIAAMLSWLPDGDAEKTERAMVRGMEGVETGEVTFSVRDTTFGDLAIKEGDILGLWNGQVRLKGSSPEDVLAELLSQMVEAKGGEVISVYYGQEITSDRAEALSEALRSRFSGHEVEIQAGGQPLYYYICSLE